MLCVRRWSEAWPVCMGQVLASIYIVLFIYATIGLLYFTLVTDDPLENSFLSLAEKQLLAQQQGRLTSPQHSTASATRPPDIKANLRHTWPSTLHLNCSLRIINLVA